MTFYNRLKADRAGLLGELAGLIFDHHDTKDLKALWVSVNDGSLPQPYRPLHSLTDEEIVDTAIDLHAERLARHAEDLFLEEHQLDMAVYDCGGNADINNGGFEEQIRFLLRHNHLETVEKLLRTLDEDGNYET